SNNPFSMRITSENKLRKLIIVGDRVLIRLKKSSEKTSSGLYLPPGVQEKERVQQGYIIKTGPGYPNQMTLEENETWEYKEENVKNIPLQAKEGDLAIFLVNSAHEVIYEGEKYFNVSKNTNIKLEI